MTPLVARSIIMISGAPRSWEAYERQPSNYCIELPAVARRRQSRARAVAKSRGLR